MPRWLQIALHLGALGIGSYAAVATGSPIPVVVSGGIQAAIGAIAQTYNTDGTPQSVAFSSNKKVE